MWSHLSVDIAVKVEFWSWPSHLEVAELTSISSARCGRTIKTPPRSSKIGSVENVGHLSEMVSHSTMMVAARQVRVMHSPAKIFRPDGGELDGSAREIRCSVRLRDVVLYTDM